MTKQERTELRARLQGLRDAHAAADKPRDEQQFHRGAWMAFDQAMEEVETFGRRGRS